MRHLTSIGVLEHREEKAMTNDELYAGIGFCILCGIAAYICGCVWSDALASMVSP